MTDSTVTSSEIHQKRESCWPEILKRVPVSQLGVCLCVSKQWYSLITSSVFISSQINFLSQSSNLYLLRSFSIKHPTKKTKEVYHICSETVENLKTLDTLKNLTKKSFDCPFQTRSGLQFRLVGSVNGVIYLSDDNFSTLYTFILWNPLVNCFIQLPKPRACFDAIGPYMTVSGLGYDGVKNDFKVIRVVYLERSDRLDETPPRAELYSVNEGKWRWINADNVEFCIVDKAWTQCFVKGSVHWVAYERFGVENGSSHKRNVLLLFNVEKEKFMMMKLPLETREVCPFSLNVSEWQGMLCVNHYVKTEIMFGEFLHYNLWVKKEYYKGASWSKVASVDLCGGSIRQVIYWRKTGELLALNKGSELVSYNPETNHVVVLEPDVPALYETISFVESLAFLNKDCKNRRSFLMEEDDNNSSDDEEHSLDKFHFAKMGQFFGYLSQVDKFRREF